ncbi:thymidylate kinase [Adlercreutzia sp. ZJ473]|uniref:thymidylate kinase n=1 Tax=Adlercreutzia sp. ZJ473 TaxID=2722822 RepID=UPI001555A80F|nr:thymidylate kinase [Adlercreutzia sp. ZJ473]
MTAKLIAVEGLDGSGKETQARLLRSALEARGLRVESVSFPRYGQSGAVLVEEYLRGDFGADPEAVNAYAASSFFAMDRFASYLREWKDLYEGCDVFLADRYVTSNAIHQCSKLPRGEWESFLLWLFDYEYGKLGLPEPAQVFYLHLGVGDSQRLLDERYHGDQLRKDIHEHDVEYLRKSQAAAEYCCGRCGWERVECMRGGRLRSVEDIHAEILERLES